MAVKSGAGARRGAPDGNRLYSLMGTATINTVIPRTTTSYANFRLALRDSVGVQRREVECLGGIDSHLTAKDHSSSIATRFKPVAVIRYTLCMFPHSVVDKR